MPDDIDVAVVGAELEEDLSWTVPLIDDFLDEIFAIAQLKAHWPFVALPACVAVHAQLHLMIVAQNRFEMPSAPGFLSLVLQDRRAQTWGTGRKLWLSRACPEVSRNSVEPRGRAAVQLP